MPLVVHVDTKWRGCFLSRGLILQRKDCKEGPKFHSYLYPMTTWTASPLPNYCSFTAKEENEENSPPTRAGPKCTKTMWECRELQKFQKCPGINDSTGYKERNFGHLLPLVSLTQESERENAVCFYFPFNKQSPNIRRNLRKKSCGPHTTCNHSCFDRRFRENVKNPKVLTRELSYPFFRARRCGCICTQLEHAHTNWQKEWWETDSSGAEEEVCQISTCSRIQCEPPPALSAQR